MKKNKINVSSTKIFVYGPRATVILDGTIITVKYSGGETFELDVNRIENKNGTMFIMTNKLLITYSRGILSIGDYRVRVQCNELFRILKDNLLLKGFGDTGIHVDTIPMTGYDLVLKNSNNYGVIVNGVIYVSKNINYTKKIDATIYLKDSSLYKLESTLQPVDYGVDDIENGIIFNINMYDMQLYKKLNEITASIYYS